MITETTLLTGLILYLLYYHFVEKRKNLPPGPVPLPFFGNLLSLGAVDQDKTINKWSKEYGPIFTLWFGRQPHIVITDYELLRETLVKQGESFAGRINQFVLDSVRYGHQYGIATNDGQIWKQQRRFALHVLKNFGFGRPLMEEKIRKEVDKMIRNIDELLVKSEDQLISVDECMELCVANIISSLLMGHTLERETKFRELKQTQERLLTVLMSPQALLLGQYPCLRFLPIFGHFGYDSVCEVRDAFFDIIGREIEEHKTHFDPDAEATDYTAAFLKEMNRREGTGEDLESFTMRQLNVTLFDMWFAGMETTFTALKWALLYMLHHPEVQEMCWQEMSETLNKPEKKVIQMADRNEMPFLAATLAEIQRCANLVPLNFPHMVTRDTTVSGFSLPRGIGTLPQISAVMSDERYFLSPEKFDPWRFLTDDGKSLQSLEHVIPFGIGKRACPGESLARMELFLIFSTLIQKYKFSVPEGGELPTLESKPGFLRTPHPYKLVLEKRL